RRTISLAAAFALAALSGCGTSGSPRGAGPSTGSGGGDTADAAPPSIDAGPPIIPPLGIDASMPPVKQPIGDRVILRGMLPNGVEGLFAGAAKGPGPGPVVVYPAPDTMFPPNIARVLFQWRATTGNVFRVHFDTGKGVLDVYTDGVHDTCDKAGTGAKCWESAADTLMPYLDVASGGKVDFTIAALDANAPTT